MFLLKRGASAQQKDEIWASRQYDMLLHMDTLKFYETAVNSSFYSIR